MEKRVTFDGDGDVELKTNLPPKVALTGMLKKAFTEDLIDFFMLEAVSKMINYGFPISAGVHVAKSCAKAELKDLDPKQKRCIQARSVLRHLGISSDDRTRLLLIYVETKSQTLVDLVETCIRARLRARQMAILKRKLQMAFKEDLIGYHTLDAISQMAVRGLSIRRCLQVLELCVRVGLDTLKVDKDMKRSVQARSVLRHFDMSPDDWATVFRSYDETTQTLVDLVKRCLDKYKLKDK